MRRGVEQREQAIVDAVVTILRTEGYDAVQVRRVAADASVSLSTVYKLFGTLDELLVRAVESWMGAHAYVAPPGPAPERPPYEVLSALLRSIFEPWEREPQMLRAFIRAALGPGGERLRAQAFAFAEPAASPALAGLDPALGDDLRVITEHVAFGAVTRFALGEIAADEILPIVDGTLRRLLDVRAPTRPVDPPDRARTGP